MGRSFVIVAAALAVAVPAKSRAQEPSTAFSIQGQIGGGAMVRDLKTDNDLVYGLILGLHFLGPLGLELDYHHAENNLKDTSIALKQDGIFGHVRLDLTSGSVVPFLYAGVGWVRYSSSSSLLSGTTDRAVIPTGAGIEFDVRPLVLGIRGEYQWGTNEIAGQHADYWKAVATVGVRIP